MAIRPIQNHNQLLEAPKITDTDKKAPTDTSNSVGGFMKGLARGFAQGVGIDMPKTFKDWLTARKLKPLNTTGIKDGKAFTGYSNGQKITLWVNRNNNKKIYFENDGIYVPLNLMDNMYPDWSGKDSEIINKLAKDSGLEAIDGFRNIVYDALRPFMINYKLNIYEPKWQQFEVLNFNKAIEAGAALNNTTVNTIIMNKLRDDLEESNISNTELLELYGAKQTKFTSRKEICTQILKNQISTVRAQMPKIPLQRQPSLNKLDQASIDNSPNKTVKDKKQELTDILMGMKIGGQVVTDKKIQKYIIDTNFPEFSAQFERQYGNQA